MPLPVKPKSNSQDDLLAAATARMAELEQESDADLRSRAQSYMQDLELDDEDYSVVSKSPARSLPVQPKAQLPLPANQAPLVSLQDIKDAKRDGVDLESQAEASRFHGAAPWQERMGDTAVMAGQGVIDAAQGAVGAADVLAPQQGSIGLADIGVNTGFGGFGKMLQDAGLDLNAASAWLDKFYSKFHVDDRAAKDQADGFLAKAQAILSHPALIEESVVRSLPSMYVGGKIGQGLGRMGAVAEHLAGAAGEGVVQAGQMAESLRAADPSGFTPPAQEGAAIASGVTTGALSALGGRIAAKLGIEDIDTMVAAGATNPSARHGLLSSILLGAFQEGVAEELPQSITEQAWQNLATGRPLLEGVDEAGFMGMLTGALMGAGAQATDIGAKPLAARGTGPQPGTWVQPEAPALPQPGPNAAGGWTYATSGAKEGLDARYGPRPQPQLEAVTPVLPGNLGNQDQGHQPAPGGEQQGEHAAQPTMPVAPPPSLNPNISDELIQSLRGAGVGPEVIRHIADEDEGKFILDSAAQPKPKAPVRAKREFPQTPGMQGYLGKDQAVQDEVELDNFLNQPPKGEDNVTAGTSNEPENVGAAGEGAGDGEERSASRPRVPQSTPIGRETPNQTERRRAEHYESVWTHTLEAARQAAPDVDEHELRKEFDERVGLAEEASNVERDYGPRTVLEEVAKLGGISADSEHLGGMSGELAWVKEAQGAGGALAGVRGVFRRRTMDDRNTTVTGHGMDRMVTLLSQDPRFAPFIQDQNDLLELLEEASRHGVADNRGVFPGTEELRKFGVIPEERWWEAAQQPDADAHIDESPTDQGDASFDVKEFDQATEDALGGALDDLDALLGRTSVVRAKRSIGDVLTMSSGPSLDPKVLAAVVQTFRTLHGAGVHAFDKAVHVLADKKGEEFVRKLAPALGKAWDMARRGNSQVGPAGDVEAILSTRKGNGTATPEPGAAGGSREAGGPGSGQRDTGPGHGPAGDRGDAGVQGREPDTGVVAGEPRPVQPATDEAAEPRGEGLPTREQQRAAADDSSHFAPYARRSRIRGTEHPKVVVEARALAGVEYPELTTKFESPVAREAITAGRVSVEQAEQALAAVQANLGEQGKPGHGYLIADAGGVGKSRELALTLLELMHRAEKDGRELRLLFTTLREPNIVDFIDNELPFVASGRTKEGRNLDKHDELAIEHGAPGTVPFKVVMVTDTARPKGGQFTKLPKVDRGIYVVDHVFNFRDYMQPLADIGLHGIVADEAHEVRNVRDSTKGIRWQLLHAHIYKTVPRNEQVFVYSTATPAQDPKDFEYLYGLRMWPIDGFADWLQVITGRADTTTANRILDYINNRGNQAIDSGISIPAGANAPIGRSLGGMRMTRAEAEQIPRELKALGRYSARDLWRGAVKFNIWHAPDGSEHNARLPEAEEKRYNKFASLSVDILNGAQKLGHLAGNSAMMMQVHAQLVLAAKRMQMEATLHEAIKRGQKYVATGHQVVFSVMNVSATDMGTHGNLYAAIQAIPENKLNPDGSTGAPIPGAAELKAKLRERAREIGKLLAPAEALKETFGAGNVAELVGGMDDAQKASVRQFQAGKRDVILISAAGSTGVNLQQRFLTGKGAAQGRRVFIPIQNEWSAMREMQRYWRVDRADSVQPPIIEPISFGSALQKRFFGSIASRMKSTGALSTGGGSEKIDAFDQFDFTDRLSLAAVRAAWSMAPDDLKALFWGRNFQDASGPREDLPDSVNIETVQKALMFMPVGRANQFWNLFVNVRDELKEQQFDLGDENNKTREVNGRVLNTVELGPQLTLHRAVDDAGRKFGILQGVVTPFMPRIAPVISDSAGRPRRAYTVLKVNKTGQFIAGLDLEWARIERVARAFGKDLDAMPISTKQQVINALLVGEVVPLQGTNEKGRGLELRASHYEDKRVIITNATTKMRARLTEAGATYSPQNNTWFVARADLSKFLDAFQPAGDWGMVSGEEPEALYRTTRSQQKRKALWRQRLTDPNLNLTRPKGAPVTKKAEDQMSPRAIRELLEKGLGITIQPGVGSMQAWGFYRLTALGAARMGLKFKTHPEIIRLKVAEDLPVMMHEVGHHLAERVLGLTLANYDAELKAIGAPTTLSSYATWQKHHEGAAEFVRRWMTDPASAFAMAPTFGADWEEALQRKPEVWKVLKAAQQQVLAFTELDGAERIKATLSFDPKDGTTDKGPVAYTHWDQFRREVIDDLSRLEQAVKDMSGGVAPMMIEDAYKLARSARGTAEKAQGWLEHGVRDENGQFVTTGLKGILSPVSDRLEDFATYLVAARAIELHSRQDVTEWAINPAWAHETINKLRSPEFENARQQIYKFQHELLEYAVRRGVISAKQQRAMERMNRSYVPFMRVMDAWAAAYGNSSSEAMANLNGPFKRIRGSGRDIINPLESIVKNTFVLVNIAEHNQSMQALTDMATMSAGSGKWLERDNTPKKPHTFNLADLEKQIREKLSDEGIDVPLDVDFNELVDLWIPASYVDGSKRYVTVLKKGQREWWKVNDKELFDTIRALGPRISDPVLEWFLFKPASLLRASVTRTPSFILRNFMRDPLVAYFQSKYGFVPVIDHAYGLFHVMGRTDLFHAAINAGMGQATLEAKTREGASRQLRKVTGQKAQNPARRAMDVISTPFSMLSAVSEAIELAPRVAEFRLGVLAEGRETGLFGRIKRSVTDKGQGDRVKKALNIADENMLRTAALAGRDLTLDFQRGGRAVRSGNRAIPFLNAQVQGFARAGETVAKGFKNKPLETAIKLGTVPFLTLMLWALNHRDDDYRKLEQWERDTYWHIPARFLGGKPGAFYRIPKPFEYASLFGNTLEAAMDYVWKEDPDAVRRLMSQLAGSNRGTGDLEVTDIIGGIAVRLTPALLLPILEVEMNHSFFFDRNISSDNQGDRDFKWLDYDRWTSRTARELGRVMNLSPKKIEHVIYGYTGNMGRGMLQGSDYAQEKLGAIPVQPKRGLGDVPGLGAIYTEPGHRGQSRAIRRLYDVEDKLRGIESDLRDTPIGELAKRLEVLRNHPDLVGVDANGEVQRTGRATLIRQGVQMLRAQRKGIDAVLENEKLSAADKRQRLDKIADQMDLAARIALGEPVHQRQPAAPVAAR